MLLDLPLLIPANPFEEQEEIRSVELGNFQQQKVEFYNRQLNFVQFLI